MAGLTTEADKGDKAAEIRHSWRQRTKKFIVGDCSLGDALSKLERCGWKAVCSSNFSTGLYIEVENRKPKN